ncbi:MAG: hypothetical protein Q8L85_00135 [Alphaproteobacteria bacterium]|nr:hypothetical protein [Alphaproteobacteria bacterium]
MKKLCLILCLATPLLAGCAAKSGNQFLEKTSDAEVASKLIANKTTKAEVKNTYGDPVDFDLLSDGKELWTYKFTRSSAKGINYIPYASLVYNGTNDTTKRLKILFNKDGIVENHTFSTSAGETKRGAFQ